MKARILTGLMLATTIMLSAFMVPVSAHTIYPTPEEFYDYSDLIILGTIVSTDGSKSEMQYEIQVKEFVKNPNNITANIIEAYGCNPSPPGVAVTGGCQFFEKDQDIFLGLHKDDQGRLLLGGGFQIPNKNCTGEQLLQAINRETGIHVSQNDDLHLFVGEKTNMTYDVLNQDLVAKNVTVILHVNRINDAAKIDTHTEIIDVQINECQMHNIVSYSFIPQKAGRYNFSISSDEFGFSEGGIPINDKSLSPLKQIKSGIRFQNVVCKEGLNLVYKKADDTSACVTLTTEIELTVRGWAEDTRILLGCLGERVSKCYPTDPQEYRNALYKYYFGSDEDLPSYSAFDFDRLHITNACNDKPMICYGEFANGTKTRVSCDFMFYGCRNTIELHDYKTDDK